MGANRSQGERTDMYTEKMGSVQRFSQPSYLGANSWFNGLNPVKPRWLTWPPCWRVAPLHLKAWEMCVYSWSGSWDVWIQTVLHLWPPDKALGHPTDPSVKGRWRGSLTRTTHHAMTHRWEPAQAGFVTLMGTVSVCVYCMCAHVPACTHVL